MLQPATGIVARSAGPCVSQLGVSQLAIVASVRNTARRETSFKRRLSATVIIGVRFCSKRVPVVE